VRESVCGREVVSEGESERESGREIVSESKSERERVGER
jgi:hypothetical protein